MSELQTPPEGTEEQDKTTPQAGLEQETPQTPADEAVETPETESTPEQAPSDPQQAPVTDPQPSAPDYKEKFVHSQRESILNGARVEAANARIDSLTKQDTPTDEAMRQLYPEWDDLNDVTKKAFIKQEAQEMKQRQLEIRQQEILERQKLDDQLDEIIDTSEYAPKLKGRENEFRRFAKNPKNRGIDASVLARAFLFDASDDEPAAPQAQPAPKVEGLPQGSGGPRGDLKPKKVSLEEAKHIRETDYKRYRELVLAGAIEDDID